MCTLLTGVSTAAAAVATAAAEQQVNWDDLGSTKIDNKYYKGTYLTLMKEKSRHIKSKYLVWCHKFPARIIPDDVSCCLWKFC
jgi:hypothetical protein